MTAIREMSGLVKIKSVFFLRSNKKDFFRFNLCIYTIQYGLWAERAGDYVSFIDFSKRIKKSAKNCI